MQRRALLQRAAGALSGVAGLTGLAIAGCAGPGGQGEAPKPSISGPATAKVLTFNNDLFQQARDELVRALADTDSQLKPDITVFPGQIAAFREKMLAIYAGGDVPDAQWVHPSITGLSASKKLLRPLEDLARRDKDTSLADFYQGVLDYFRWRGGTYALPWYSPGYVFAFNRALFAKLGVTPPDQQEKEGKWTWDAFVSTLRGLTTGSPGSQDRTIGFHTYNMNLDWTCASIWRNGGDVFSKDGKRCVLNEPASVEVVEGLADLHLKYRTINYGTNTPDFPGGFNSGRIGLRQLNKEAVAPERNDLSQADFPLGMAPVYKGKAGRINRMGTLGFGVAQGAPNGDAGWRFVRFMGGPHAAAVLMGHKSTLPVRPRFAQLPAFAQSTLPWENKDVWLESQATARAMAQPGSYQDISDLWDAAWKDVLAQKAPVKALLDDMVRQANAVLAQES